MILKKKIDLILQSEFRKVKYENVCFCLTRNKEKEKKEWEAR